MLRPFSSLYRVCPAKTVLMWLHGLSAASGKDRHSRSPNSLVSNHHGGLSARPWRRVGQSSHHVSSMCRSAYCFLRQLRQVVRSLTEDAAKTVVHAFISMRLNYCNSLLCGISATLLRRLQSVQNAAARVITRTPRRDHITPILHRLHWLPVRQRVAFKFAVLVYKALNNRAPEYLSQDCRLVGDSGRRELRSSHNYTCASVTSSTRFGDRAFAAAGPRLWNSLPGDVRRSDFTVGS